MPAIEGGNPIRSEKLPNGRQTVDEKDVAAVVEVLRSPWLTTGPKVAELEAALARATGAADAVALANGTAALHAAAFALDVGPGDEVIVPPITFAATANSVVFQSATPVFADVDPGTLLIDPATVERKITSRTKAIMAVDFAGQPCDYDALRKVAAQNGLALVADACHALGASLDGRTAGSLADLTVFSLHPVKPITAGEGGIVTTDNADFASRIRRFRNHGIDADHRQRAQRGSWHYEMVDLGYNYRITDIQCALALSQLDKLDGFIERRRQIARQYDEAFAENALLTPLAVNPGVGHGYHLYVVELQLERLRVDRERVFQALQAEGINVGVHYIPVHLHPYYREHFRTAVGDCPVAEAAYERILSLPIFPAMSDEDVADVIEAVEKVTEAYRR